MMMGFYCGSTLSSSETAEAAQFVAPPQAAATTAHIQVCNIFRSFFFSFGYFEKFIDAFLSLDFYNSYEFCHSYLLTTNQKKIFKTKTTCLWLKKTHNVLKMKRKAFCIEKQKENKSLMKLKEKHNTEDDYIEAFILNKKNDT